MSLRRNSICRRNSGFFHSVWVNKLTNSKKRRCRLELEKKKNWTLPALIQFEMACAHCNAYKMKQQNATLSI